MRLEFSLSSFSNQRGRVPKNSWAEICIFHHFLLHTHTHTQKDGSVTDGFLSELCTVIHASFDYDTTHGLTLAVVFWSLPDQNKDFSMLVFYFLVNFILIESSP